MRNIQLYATGSATGTSVAQVTIPSASRIIGFQIDFAVDSVTDNSQVRLEFSKVPTNQIGTNGALDPILEIGVYNNFVTSGMTQSGLNHFFPCDVQVRAGDIIYVHATVAGTATYYVNAILHLLG